MDLSCPWTVQDEIFHKCRETIPPSPSLFQIWIICYRFEVIVKNQSQPVKILTKFSLFF